MLATFRDLKDWELDKFGHQAFSSSFEGIVKVISDVIQSMDSSAHATIISENREAESREHKQERKKIFARAKSSGYSSAKSFKVACNHT